MLSIGLCDNIDQVQPITAWFMSRLESVIIIVWLMLSVCSKVISLSGLHCSSFYFLTLSLCFYLTLIQSIILTFFHPFMLSFLPSFFPSFILTLFNFFLFLCLPYLFALYFNFLQFCLSPSLEGFCLFRIQFSFKNLFQISTNH